MRVILIEKVPSLGNIGEIVNVSQGYGRNFLLPRQMAVLADKAHRKQLENQKRKLAKKIEAEKAVAMDVHKKLDGFVLELIKKVGANGKLFGSVTTMELSSELEQKGINVEKRTIMLVNPIKATGIFNAQAKLFNDIVAKFKVKVTMDPAQVEEFKKKEALAQKAKEEEAAAKAAAAELGESKEEEKVMTEDERLKAEADKIIRG